MGLGHRDEQTVIEKGPSPTKATSTHQQRQVHLINSLHVARDYDTAALQELSERARDYEHLHGGTRTTFCFCCYLMLSCGGIPLLCSSTTPGLACVHEVQYIYPRLQLVFGTWEACQGRNVGKSNCTAAGYQVCRSRKGTMRQLAEHAVRSTSILQIYFFYFGFQKTLLGCPDRSIDRRPRPDTKDCETDHYMYLEHASAKTSR